MCCRSQFSSGYRNLIAHRQEAFKIGNKEKYKKLINECNRKAPLLKAGFYQRSVDNVCDDRNVNRWKTIKVLIGLKAKDSTLECYANSHFNGDLVQLTESINNVFVSVSMDLDPLQQETYPSNAELPDELIITVDSVEKQMLKTRLHKPIGPDQIPNCILKDLDGIIATPISHLFNSSLQDSYVLTLWNIVNVCPLPKSKPVQNLKKDLRPISLTPVIAKMMEYYPIQYLSSGWSQSVWGSARKLHHSSFASNSSTGISSHR